MLWALGNKIKIEWNQLFVLAKNQRSLSNNERPDELPIFHNGTTGQILQVIALLLLSTLLLSAWAQQKDLSGENLLRHALYLADLYNWAEAGPEFTNAEQIFSVVGDQRNALFARLGTIRSTIEQRVLPVTSADLAQELRDQPPSSERQSAT